MSTSSLREKLAIARHHAARLRRLLSRSEKYWMPGAERIPGIHSSGLPMDGTGQRFVTHHITVTGKGSYDGAKSALLQERYEPTLLIDPTNNKRGQFLPANRGGYALEHNGPTTNTEGSVNIQIEWVWPSMSDDITKATHFNECWADVVAFARSLGVPDVWPFGFHSTSKDLSKWRTSGHRGHVNAPGNSHSDNLPAKRRPTWPASAPSIRARLAATRHHITRLRRRLHKAA